LLGRSTDGDLRAQMRVAVTKSVRGAYAGSWRRSKRRWRAGGESSCRWTQRIFSDFHGSPVLCCSVSSPVQISIFIFTWGSSISWEQWGQDDRTVGRSCDHVSLTAASPAPAAAIKTNAPT
jgi:hypothetical protein